MVVVRVMMEEKTMEMWRWRLWEKKIEEARNKWIVQKREVGGEDLGWNPLGPLNSVQMIDLSNS